MILLIAYEFLIYLLSFFANSKNFVGFYSINFSDYINYLSYMHSINSGSDKANLINSEYIFWSYSVEVDAFNFLDAL